MLKLVTTSKFRKDYKLVKKRGYPIKILEEVLDKLLAGEPLDEKFRDHALVGN